ncbi:caspase domain-containing protein [Cytidiella melzeri]|nr:caspase domain-containing protein [Cytidiella melzeri]
MWNEFPGNQHHQHHPPSAPPAGPPPMGFPSPGYPGTAPPGYAPSYSSPPPGPPGPPDAYGSYGFPSGPPTLGPHTESTYPGRPHGFPSPSGPTGFPSPAGPPSNYPRPPGPPPPNHYNSPSGPPPSGAYAPPSGPPPRSYASPSGPPPIPARIDGPPSIPPRMGQGSFAPPPGPPPRPPTQQQTYGPSFDGANNTRQQPFFQYSQCTGKKKALCVGINYFGQQAELKGCINDARNVQRFICTHFGYKADDIVMLTDDAQNPRQIPTKQNIIQAMQWLVRDAHPNDSLFFHYSGHGGQTKDVDGDEADGYDETIYPVDFKQNGHIVDDVMHDVMVKPLPPGCRLTAIFDSCHSGSALDLPYIYSTEGKVKEPNLAAEAGQGLLSAVTSYARGDMGSVFSSVSGIIKSASGSSQRAERKARATKTSPADAISWSGCKDSQTSADTVEAGQSTGAMSYAFIKVLSQNSQQSYQQLLINIRTVLKQKYSQKPQLSASHPMDVNLMFIC